MSVHIVAYSQLALLPEDDNPSEWHRARGHVNAYTLAGLEHSGAGLELGRWYARTAETQTAEVADLGYGAYGGWREQLSRSVLGVEPREVWRHPDAYRDRPFFEVVNFADNEGTIGPDAARALLDDFQRSEHRGRFVADAEPWQVRVYDAWTAGLALASDAGLVRYT